jgi:hypothetical protein
VPSPAPTSWLAEDGERAPSLAKFEYHGSRTFEGGGEEDGSQGRVSGLAGRGGGGGGKGEGGDGGTSYLSKLKVLNRSPPPPPPPPPTTTTVHDTKNCAGNTHDKNVLVVAFVGKLCASTSNPEP